jgi:predicted RNA-binding Zn-ribbon protein involved in translation (DUF1610 family)
MEALAASIGSITSFSSRTFLPCFVAACMLRFAPDSWLAPDIGLLQSLGEFSRTPTWFTHDLTLIVLGLLSALELGANKIPEAREALLLVDKYLKPVAAMIVASEILTADDRAFIEQTVGQAGVLDWAGSLAIAGAVYVAALMRSSLLGTIFEIDEDDDAGVQGLLSWVEDAWSALGIVAAFLFPFLMLALAGLGVLTLWLAQRFLEKREAKRRTPCAKCAHEMSTAALACPACGEANPSPMAVTWLGVAGRSLAAVDQPHRLEQFRRCHRCAERLEKREVSQTCPACGTVSMDSPETVHAFDAWVRRRLPVVLVVTTLLSLIPVMGLIPAVIYSRLAIVAPYRRSIPRLRSFLIRLALRALLLLAIGIQFIPILGAIGIPLSAIASHLAYRSAFLKLAAPPSPAGA